MGQELQCQTSLFLSLPAKKGVSQFSYLNQDQKSQREIQMKKGINCFKCQFVLAYISKTPISVLLFYCGNIKLLTIFFFFGIHSSFLTTKLSCARIWFFSHGSNISACYKQHMDIDYAMIMCATFQGLIFSHIVNRK